MTRKHAQRELTLRTRSNVGLLLSLTRKCAVALSMTCKDVKGALHLILGETHHWEMSETEPAATPFCPTQVCKWSTSCLLMASL